MEDAATAEISRAQVWQWIHPPRASSTTAARSRPSCVARCWTKSCANPADLGPAVFDQGKFTLAREVFENVATRDDFVDFLTLPAYEHLA